MRQGFLAILLPLSVVVATGCTTAPPPAAPAAPAVAEQPAPAHPQIVGSVTLSTTQKPAPLGGVVYLDNSPKQAGALMKTDVVIHHKEFVPFISVLTAGGTATFSNIDTVDHHIFSSAVKGWDTGILKKGHPVSRVFAKAGAYPLLCNIHPEMLGYLLVIPSTTYAKVGSQGTYELGDVPPGTYQLSAWVPRAPVVTKPVTVTASGIVTVDFVIKPNSTQPNP